MLVLTRSFYGREDPALTARLLTELPGILNWAVHGYRRLRQRGYFVQPASAREAIEDLEVLGLADQGVSSTSAAASGPDARCARSSCSGTTWRAWCEASGRPQGAQAPSRPSAATSRPPSRACDPHARGTMTTATAATRASD